MRHVPGYVPLRDCSISRRHFLSALAAAGAACCLPRCFGAAASSPTSAPLRLEDFIREAEFWTAEGQAAGSVACRLCPRHCTIAGGERGACGVRECRGGRLFTLVHGRACHASKTRIEDCALWHFYPGEQALLVGTAGCNLACADCQAACRSLEATGAIDARPKTIAASAQTVECPTVAFDVMEPLVAIEWLREAMAAVRASGRNVVLGTNGFVAPEALAGVIPHLSAAKVELRGFSEDAYGRCGARLEPVLETLKALKSRGIWLEIAWPVVPGENDAEEDCRRAAQWIASTLGPDVPLHFLRSPARWDCGGSAQASRSSLTLRRKLAMREGLRHVYVHGFDDHDGRRTYCPECLMPVVLRNAARAEPLITRGACPFCGKAVAGCWKSPSAEPLRPQAGGVV